MLTREIFSLQHPIVKHVVKLRENRRYRYLHNQVVVSGNKLIEELASFTQFKKMFIEKGEKIGFSFQTEETWIVPSSVLKKITAVAAAESMAAVVSMPHFHLPSPLDTLLILDGISDPGNLGTLLRSALALGWHSVFLTPDTTDPYHEKALRAAKGATFKLPWSWGSWEELQTILERENLPLFGAEIQGKPLTSFSFQRGALALGNEAHGLSEQVRSLAESIAIPMHPGMESLNVASAGAILLFHLRGSS